MPGVAGTVAAGVDSISRVGASGSDILIDGRTPRTISSIEVSAIVYPVTLPT